MPASQPPDRREPFDTLVEERVPDLHGAGDAEGGSRFGERDIRHARGLEPVGGQGRGRFIGQMRVGGGLVQQRTQQNSSSQSGPLTQTGLVGRQKQGPPRALIRTGRCGPPGAARRRIVPAVRPVPELLARIIEVQIPEGRRPITMASRSASASAATKCSASPSGQER
ncbi:hypothetical protein GCM10010245_84430 [Streptomyces spectabilis]|nr:hypothetical protein GCM10010245_84430 [Streptomyces spectabilis]